MNYASIDAYNFLALLGGNWTESGEILFASVSYQAFGTAVILITVFTAVFVQWRSSRRERRCAENSGLSFRMLFLTAAFCIYTIYTFGHYMHERYLFFSKLLFFSFNFFKHFF